MTKAALLAIIALTSCVTDEAESTSYNCVSDPVAKQSIVQPCHPPGVTRGQQTLDAAAAASRQVGHVMPGTATAECGATSCGSDFQFDNYSRLSMYCVWYGGESECHASLYTRVNIFDSWRLVWQN